MKKLLLPLMIVAVPLTPVCSMDDNPAIKVYKWEKEAKKRSYVITYHKKGDRENVFKTPSLNQEQVNDFIHNNPHLVILGINFDKPIHEVKERAGSQERRFVVSYKKTLSGREVHQTHPLNQEELNNFLSHNPGYLVVGIDAKDPIYPVKDAENLEELRYIVSYKKKADDPNIYQTQPLNQHQLNIFLGDNPGYLVVGIKTNKPIHPPLEESDEVRIFKEKAVPLQTDDEPESLGRR